MKLISWNVNGVRALEKKGGFDWLIKQKPDIFCVQELKAEKEQLSQELQDPEGYFSYFDSSKSRKGYSGVAVFSKIKPENVTYGLGVKELDQEGRQINLFFKDFIFINCYFPNGGGGPERLEYKLKYYEEFLKFVDKLRKSGYKVIWTGDVNVAHTEIDIARPKENENHVGFLPIERAWMDRVKENGWVDVFRYFEPVKKEVYTYWDMKTFARDRNVGWRIDYFFVSPELKKNLKRFITHGDVFGSDHCPIELDIEV